jgi:hypothetical protein
LRLESVLERRRSIRAFNHYQIIVLTLETGRGKVRGACAQLSPVDLVVLPSDWQKL